jgi:hypothetical protein
MVQKLCGLFAIDARSLAAFRIAAGAILLVDVSIRAVDFTAHYTEAGVLPLATLDEWLGPSSWRWSLYKLVPANWWPATLLGLTAVCGGLLILGMATRVATVAAWILVVSLHNRMPLVINAGDTLLHSLLFWGMFLPLGTKWSLDAARRSPSGMVRSDAIFAVCSPASAAILVQIAVLYLASGIYKLGNADWHSGLSLYYVMSYDAYARPAAAWMLDHGDLLRLLTWATVVLEIGGPIAAFCPWFTGPVRLVVIGSFIAFHAGIEATMTVGLFSWVSMAGWLLFLPPCFWAMFGTWLSKSRVGPETDGGMEAGRNEGTNGIGGSSSRVPPFLHSSIPRFLRPCTAIVVLALLAFILYWNASGFRSRDTARRPEWCRPVAEITGLRQEWRMFTRPPKHDGWPRVAAVLTNGSEWDLLSDVPGFDWRRRELPSSIAPNHRWRKYYANLITPRSEKLRGPFCRFLARRFESRHAERIAKVSLYEVEEITGRPGEETKRIRKLLHQETIRTQGAFLDAAEGRGSRAAELHPGI